MIMIEEICPECGAECKLVSIPPDRYAPDGLIYKCTKCEWNDMW